MSRFDSNSPAAGEGNNSSDVWFLPRDAMRKRGLCFHPVSFRSSVCLSVTFVYCIQIAEDIVKLLSQHGSPIILVFTPSASIQFQGEQPLQRGRKIHGGGKNL